jgi:branched-chain amino acid transport system substrate-binding protein
MRSHRLHGLTIVLFSVLVLGALWPSAAHQPIRIGATMSETGSLATQGVPARNGYLLCQKHVNDLGGILGRKVDS